MSNAVGQEIVASSPSADLALVANHFISQFEGEQAGQCQAALALILESNQDSRDLSLGLKELIASALQAAYLQGYAESNQSSAGSFHLDVDVPLPTITFAVKFNKAIKFAIQTAYSLGRKYGKAEKQTAIASGEVSEALEKPDEFGLYLWASTLNAAYHLRLSKKNNYKSEDTENLFQATTISVFDTTVAIYCQYRFGSEDVETVYKVVLLVEQLAKVWKPGQPLPQEPSKDDLK